MPGPISQSNPGPTGRKQNVVTCVWCGHEYPSGTPRKQHDLLYAHALECPKHPAAKFRKQVEAVKQICDEFDPSDRLDPDNLAHELRRAILKVIA